MVQGHKDDGDTALTVRLPVKLRADLRIAAAEANVSTAEYIRRALKRAVYGRVRTEGR